MTNRIILKCDLNAALREGIVAFIYEKDGQKAHAFFTQNAEITNYVSPQADIEQLDQYNAMMAFDILSQKIIEIHPAFFTGEVYKITSLGEPEEHSLNFHSKLYLGNRTGAKSISKRIYEAAKSASLDELGIEDDEQFYVFDTIVELEADSNAESEDVKKLSAIYLFKETN
jgi:hypothetical protein